MLRGTEAVTLTVTATVIATVTRVDQIILTLRLSFFGVLSRKQIADGAGMGWDVDRILFNFIRHAQIPHQPQPNLLAASPTYTHMDITYLL